MPQDSIWPEESKGFCDFHENRILIYGKPKIGKTTLASKFSNPLFLLTEDGAKHVTVKGWPIRSWVEFTGKIKLLAEGAANCPFQTVVIDTVDNLVDMCDNFICEKNSADTLGDVGGGFGKGYAAFTREWKKQMMALERVGLGVVYVSHAESKSIDVEATVNPYAAALADKDGMLEMTVPTINNKRARQFVLGQVDIILYAAMDENQKRCLFTQPSRHFEAGDRSGRLPEMLPLDYDAIVNAYYGDNKDELLKKIGIGEAHLTQKNIGFTPIDDYSKLTVPQLESRLQALRILAKNKKPNAGRGQRTEETTRLEVLPKILKAEEDFYPLEKIRIAARAKHLSGRDPKECPWDDEMKAYWHHLELKYDKKQKGAA